MLRSIIPKKEKEEKHSLKVKIILRLRRHSNMFEGKANLLLQATWNT